MAAAHAARHMLAGTCVQQLAWHHQRVFCVRCSPYTVSASSSFSRSARACPDSADRRTLVLQRYWQSKAWGSTCNMAKPASSYCLCPAGADAIRRHGRSNCPQTPCVHGPPVLYGHASPLLLQTSCEALLSSSALLLPGRLHASCQLLLTGPCRQSLVGVHSSHQALGSCLPPWLPLPAHNSLHWWPDWGPAVCRQMWSEVDDSGSRTQKEVLLGSFVKLCEGVRVKACVWQQNPPGLAAATSDMGSSSHSRHWQQAELGPAAANTPQAQVQLGSRHRLGLRLQVA